MIKQILLSFFVVCLSLSVHVSAKQSSLSLKVDGMMCISCETKVANVLKSIEGVKEYSIDTQTDIVNVTFSDKKNTKDIIFSKVAKLGYKTSIIK